MTQPEDGDRRIADLNILGRAVYMAGQGVRITADLLESAIAFAADTYRDAERAFQQGMDPNIDDAKIIEEHREQDVQS